MLLAGAMDVALGSAATGVFTNSDWLWERLHKVMREITQISIINNLLLPFIVNFCCVLVYVFFLWNEF